MVTYSTLNYKKGETKNDVVYFFEIEWWSIIDIGCWFLLNLLFIFVYSQYYYMILFVYISISEVFVIEFAFGS